MISSLDFPVNKHVNFFLRYQDADTDVNLFLFPEKRKVFKTNMGCMKSKPAGGDAEQKEDTAPSPGGPRPTLEAEGNENRVLRYQRIHG